MKEEAGVTAHTVHKEDFGRLAYTGTGRIYSPEGRKIVQLGMGLPGHEIDALAASLPPIAAEVVAALRLSA